MQPNPADGEPATLKKMKEANAVLLMDKFIYYLKQHRLYTRTLGII
ncbi:hypothetical protein ACVWU7_003567 [Providencia stuartii]